MKKAALYARVSTGKQAQADLSIPDQLSSMRSWCEQNGYEVVREFIEPGASAMDDRRPEFQEMIGEACDSHRPYDAIIVHSLSRFFRDQISLCSYERKLRKNAVVLISITQLTADDHSGELTRRVIAMFDEFSSLENSKHTLRAMRENAKQGFHNGSQPPFGFDVEEVEIIGHKKPKKRLVVNQKEAEVVRSIFSLYIEGSGGLKGVASQLNGRQVLRRDHAWSTTTIHHVLTNPIYRGERLFNQIHWKSGTEKPEGEWVRTTIEAIIDPDVFDLAVKKLKQRSPAMSHPRLVSSPRLLTSILKCGVCGARMIAATGKRNLYHYYKCSTRIKKHLDLCTSRPAPMEKLDQAILEMLADRVFTPERVAAHLAERRQNNGKGATLSDLTKQLEAVRFRLANVYRAIENGIELDDVFRENLAKLKQQESDITSRIAVYEQSPQALTDSIDKAEIATFCSLLRQQLLDTSRSTTKELLQLLVSKIVLNEDHVKITGGRVPLAGAVKLAAQKKKLSTPHEVLNFNKGWRPRDDSNVRPLP
ncbi:recombinase family protein [Geobacter sp. SVR]|uniref:recombinase family protein n=1 Tax=Geobacter sp. SVR TaxID=2495594 RepID=UPI00143EFB0E|nr:recombinase family protein [Geobacter sp. SVR]BCS52651.1 recombinase RecB [Geobacter sp. SVR]GCF83911.1 recombinase RecB [Geobacter sp. SVR]